jgi:D-alanyl-D-alanine carboxypeptidase/D-alanyl-D-alanine-endopeptidase (penicillin-binding protein 4)
MFTHPEWDAYSNSLPRGGERGSTLAGRLSNVPVQAKTGSLEFARALSGYVYAKDNSVLAFSAIANNYATSGSRISRTLDAIVRTLASYDGD